MAIRAVLAATLLMACAHPTSPIVQVPHAERPPLAGRIWDVRRERFIDREALIRQLAVAQNVLLGEVHDSAEVHRAQREILDALMDTGRRPALVFEMFDADRQTEITAAQSNGTLDPDVIEAAAHFATSGWTWSFYRPLVEAALAHGLPLLAAGLPRERTRPIALHGLDGIDSAEATRLGLRTTLAPIEQEARRGEMRDEHCGMLPESMLDGMVLAQRARDGEMADRMAHAGTNGAVLIAGAEHARTDRAVPARLHVIDPAASVRSVGFLEVRPEVREPDAYASLFQPRGIPFDVVWFVTAVMREDVCAPLRHAHSARP